MMKTLEYSRLEVWSHNYINHPEERDGKDRDAVVVQIEPTTSKRDYMVEVVDYE